MHLQDVLDLARRPKANARSLENAVRKLGQALLARYAGDADLWQLTHLPPEVGPEPAWTGVALSPDDLAVLVRRRRASLPPDQAPWHALQAYPPLALFLRVCEVLAGLRLRPPMGEMTLRPGGSVEARYWPGRCLAIASLHRLQMAWRATFPEPLEWPLIEAHPGLGDWSGRLAVQGGNELRRRVAEQATAAGFLLWELERTRRSITMGQRLKFWSSTPAKEHETRLKRAAAQEMRRLSTEFQNLWLTASKVSWGVPLLAMRESFFFLVEETGRIDTNAGTQSQAFACDVFYRKEALQQLSDLRRKLDLHMPWVDSVGELYRRLREGDTWHPEVAALHRELRQRNELESFSLIHEMEQLARRADLSRVQLEARIPFWDRLNVFKSTPEKDERKELRRVQSALQSNTEAMRKRSWEVLSELRPELQLWPLLDAMETTLRQIRADCRSERDQDETNYRCCLFGLKEAQAAQKQWGRTFYQLFGPLPSPSQCLEMDTLRC